MGGLRGCRLSGGCVPSGFGMLMIFWLVEWMVLCDRWFERMVILPVSWIKTYRADEVIHDISHSSPPSQASAGVAAPRPTSLVDEARPVPALHQARSSHILVAEALGAAAYDCRFFQLHR